MTVPEMLTFAGVFITNILIGYSLGERKGSEKTIIQSIKEKTELKKELGGIQTLEADEEEKAGTRYEETEQAIEKTLDEIVENE